MTNTQICRRCGQDLELNCFWPCNLRKDWKSPTCMQCLNAKRINGKQKNKTPLRKAKTVQKTTKAQKIKNWTVRWVSELTKMQVLTRDNWKCVYCWTIHGLENTPHHTFFWWRKKYNEDYNTEKNLVTICQSCHHEIHHGIKWTWKEIRNYCEEYLDKLYFN